MRKIAQMPPMPWIGLAGGVAVIGLGGQIGGWWVTPLVGLAIGIALRRALVAALVVGGLGWGLPLAFLAVSAPVGGVAGAVAGIVGLPAAVGAIAVLVATLLVGGILSVVGAWVGLTGKRLLPAGEIEKRVRALQERVLVRMTGSRTG